MFQTSGKGSFLIILFQFLQYYVFVVISRVMLFHRHLYCDSFTREEDCIQSLLCTQRTFCNYWVFVEFQGPDFIANLSDGLKIRVNVSNAEASFLDLHSSISDCFVKTKVYDKRDDFDFDIVNFPFLDGDVPRSASYAVYIS